MADHYSPAGKTINHHISDLPDACLAHIFHFLPPSDRNRCSLVCRFWLNIEAQNRHRLSLNAKSDLISVIQSVFSRFDAVTNLSLKCDRRSTSIGDDALMLISRRCQNLIRLKLRSCQQLTDLGLEGLAKSCNKLKKLSIESCDFGEKGMNAVLENCLYLEELSVKRLNRIGNGESTEVIKPGVAGSALRKISLRDLYHGQCFEPLIVGSKGLKTLRVVRCNGDWDKVLQVVSKSVHGLIEVHLENLRVSDLGLAAVSDCRSLEIFRLLKTTSGSNLGLMCVAEKCKLLRKLHIEGWKTKRIGDEGLISVAKNCPNLRELFLVSVGVTRAGLDPLCANCCRLERLVLCGSDTVGDVEICCIADKCLALTNLCVKGCAVSDRGLDALAVGCPNLVKVKVKKCKGVTCDGVGRLMASRESLTVNHDAAAVVENQIANAANDSRRVAVVPVDQDLLRQD